MALAPKFEPKPANRQVALASPNCNLPPALPARPWQGLDASLVGVIPYAAIRLGSYDAMKALWRRSTGALLHGQGSPS